jgi:Cdc6-like AAA superfamily ATPase
MGDASRDLMRLRPVTFRYKKPFADGSKPIQYGLIAEEVDEVYPDLVAHSADGQIETVKYQVLDSMLLNEVQRQQAEIGAQKEQLQKLEQRLNAQTQQNASLLERLDKLEAVLGSASRVSGVAAVR